MTTKKPEPLHTGNAVLATDGDNAIVSDSKVIAWLDHTTDPKAIADWFLQWDAWAQENLE